MSQQITLRAEQRKQQVLAMMESLDAMGTVQLLEEMCTKWKVHEVGRTAEEVSGTAFENFGYVGGRVMPPGNSIVPDGDRPVGGSELVSTRFLELDAAIHWNEMMAMAIFHQLRRFGLITETVAAEVEAQDGDEEDDGQSQVAEHQSRDLLSKCIAIFETVYEAKRLVLCTFQTQVASVKLYNTDFAIDEAIDNLLGKWGVRFRWIDQNITPLQTVTLHLLDCAYERRLRKFDAYVFEPISYNGHDTHSYKQGPEIEQWILERCNKDITFEQWANLLSSPSSLKFVRDYLKNVVDFQFPFLTKRRDVFSFRNGIYIAEDDTFHDYETDSPLPSSIVACKFFDADFDPFSETLDWRLIPTPHMQSILDYQKLAPDVCDWMYIFLGRMLYDLNAHDGWQVIPFIKGHAGTGKSTICSHVVKNFYHPVDVGVLSNNIEVKFGLSAIYNKLVFVAPECRTTLGLEQAEFQSMVSGEDVQINQKNKTAFSVKWKTPGILAGNEAPTWGDSSNSIGRRVVVFDFEIPVTDGDMKLDEKLRIEIPDLLVKCNRAYRSMADAHGHENIWNMLGPYFKKTSGDLARSINVLDAFLGSDEVVFGPDKQITFDDFKNAVSAFAGTNNFTRPRFHADYFRGPLARHKLARTRLATTNRQGQTVNREYIVGVDLRINGVTDADNALGFL